MSDLRKLAEDLSDLDGAWGTEPSGLLEGYTSVRQGKHIVVAHCFREEAAAFIAAASPDVVLGLLDEIDRLRSVFVAENDVHRQHTRSLNKRLDMERDTIIDIAAGFRAQRDEARESVRTLAGALEELANDAEYAMRSNDEAIARDALADPVVRRIVDECPSRHQHEGNHTIECDNNAQ